MYIQRLSPGLASSYESFLLAHSETLLYHSWRYQQMLVDLLSCEQETLVALDNQQNVVGALPLMSKNGQYGKVYNSLPYYGSNGSLIGNLPQVRSELLQAYQSIVKREDVAASTLIDNPLSPMAKNEIPFHFIDQRIGQFTPLTAADRVEDSLMLSFHSKTRNMVRKAQKLGVTVDVRNNSIDFLASIHEENMSEIGGIPKSRNFFKKLSYYFRPVTDYRIYIAYLGNEAVAALLLFFYNKTVEYYTPVIRKNYRDSQALSAIIFRAMCDASMEGYSWWNWGGTWLSQAGVYRFKSRWGTKDFPYKYLTTINNRELLQAQPSELLNDYPLFFTVPFQELGRKF